MKGALAAAGLAVCALAAYWSVRIAWADSLARGESRDEAARAVRIAPDDADLHVRLSEIQKRSGADPIPEMERAARLNPANYRIWTQLALESESSRDYTAAERYLLRAAAASRQFEPRWLLVNFYFRRGDAPNFQRWARDALLIGYDDPAPIYRLCWQISPDAAAIGRMIPGRRRLLAAYLRFLLSEGKLDAAPPTVARLLPQARNDDLPDLLNYCDRLLEAHHVQAAADLWNALSSRRLIQYRPLDGIVNPSFEHDPLGHGFDWRIQPVSGVTVFRPSTGGLTLRFSGKQPEHCQLLTQFVPLPAAAGYHVRADGDPALGVNWSVAESGIRLTYDRPPGSTRFEGAMHLRHVGLVP